MKTPPLWMALLLCLMGLFTGPFQVCCLLEVPLTMFDDSVDDQYIDCSPTREARLQKQGYLPLEEKYRQTWENASRHWAQLGQAAGSFNPTYGTAIVAYTVGDNLYGDFNAAVREAGKSQSSYQSFTFSEFHFLLTKAVQSRGTKPSCYEVFRGITGVHFTVSKKLVRFGQFASSSLEKKVAQEFGEDTFFLIRTCHGVQIDDLSFHPHQEEVLIPPYEVFSVANHSKSPRGVTIRLESEGRFSNFNCGVRSAAGQSLLTPVGTPFFLWGLLLTWCILGPLGSL
ncbi:NAD(P)(+)--arginine ADP-ribosyltransferase 2-like [Candoia aspera]|uniref:NAD(P)(+)--arginine ADP-ribosyltransferase 2-like n=1 Tax=Candoia aspera TaxID=51853 RepID=UPI002FD82F37